MDSPRSNTISADLLAILRCPLTRSRLRQEGDFLIAEVGGLRYPVRDGIPVMLVEEADIVEAMRWLLAHEHVLVEGSAAVGVAALLRRLLTPGEPTVILLTGRNVAADVLRQYVLA